MKQGHHLQLTLSLDTQQRVTAVQTWHVKADGVLTPQELNKYPREANAGILEELTLWGVKYKVMMPVLRKPGMNIMTRKYVPKWNRITRPNGTTTWVIRMRLTLCGCQDWLAHLYETCAGTAARQSQRLVAPERAARHHEDWVLVTVNVEKAFLQGLTYEEIHEVTGEPRRELYFSAPCRQCSHIEAGTRL